MQDVINCCVAGVYALTPLTTQAMSGKVIEGGPALAALVGATKWGAQSKANGNLSGLILHV